MSEKKECIGKSCNSINGENHSLECQKEHDDTVFFDAGNRNPEFRYAGYKGHPLKVNATGEQRHAYKVGQAARL